MNERQITGHAHRIIALLDEGTQNLDDKTDKKLRDARNRALAVRRTGHAGHTLAGLGTLVRHEFSELFRGWALLIALAVLASGAHYWGQHQRESEIEEVDSALLADDLPIDAYLDRGFDTWLKHSSNE
ncbi:MAG: hypothetical protein RIR70_1359 [Pseudomonadota bacterium]|jgi:hypothetical protein